MTEHRTPEGSEEGQAYDQPPLDSDIQRALGDAAVWAEPPPSLRDRVKAAIDADSTPVDVSSFARALWGRTQPAQKIPGVALRQGVDIDASLRLRKELAPDAEYEEVKDDGPGAQIIPLRPRKR